MAVQKVERMAARKVVHSVGKTVDGMVEKLDGRWEKYLVEMTAESWAARSVAWMVVWKVELMDVWTADNLVLMTVDKWVEEMVARLAECLVAILVASWAVMLVEKMVV